MPMFKPITVRAGFSTGSGLAAVLQAISDNFGRLEPAVRVSAAADYVPVIGDKVISRTKADAQTVTIPTNATAAFEVGTQIRVIQSGAGALTIAAAGGVTLNHLAAKTLVAAGQFAVITLIKVGTNVWNVSGDLTAAS